MTEEKQTQAEHLAKNLKKKKVRKYILIALALAALAYTISIFSIEPPDAKLPDGQGNLPSAGQELEQESQPQEPEEKPTAQEAAVDNSQNPTASNKGNVKLKPFTLPMLKQFRDNPSSIPAFRQILDVVIDHADFFGVRK